MLIYACTNRNLAMSDVLDLIRNLPDALVGWIRVRIVENSIWSKERSQQEEIVRKFTVDIRIIGVAEGVTDIHRGAGGGHLELNPITGVRVDSQMLVRIQKSSIEFDSATKTSSFTPDKIFSSSHYTVAVESVD